MTFFGRKTPIGKIEIDTGGVSADSPEMQKRMDRIATNYEMLSEVLTELEVKIAQDERLKPVKKEAAAIESAAQTAPDQQHVTDENPVQESADPKKPR